MAESGKAKVSAAVCGLRSVHIGVADLRRTRDFLTRAWGLAKMASDGWNSFLRATGEDCYVVALHARPRTEILRIDFRAPSRVALAGIRGRLAGRAAPDLSEIEPLSDPGGGVGFRVRDPDGRLLLILAEDRGHDDAVDTIDRPRKLAHIVLNSADAPRLEDFYTEGLGFRLVDRTRRMGFFNCNSDHHSVAIVPAQDCTLNHIAFDMPSFDALMRGVGRLREVGTEMGWGVGRHGPGNNIFSYFVGPEGLPLEYTAEVQQIDDSYRAGSPEDWKPTPGRMDQWGVTAPPSPELARAEQTIGFSAETL